MDATKSAANKICQLAVGLSRLYSECGSCAQSCCAVVFWVETREEGRGGIPALPRASGKPASVEGEDPAHPQATKCIRGQQLPPFLAQLPALTAFLAALQSGKMSLQEETTRMEELGNMDCRTASALMCTLLLSREMGLFSILRRRQSAGNLKILRGFQELEIISVTCTKSNSCKIWLLTNGYLVLHFFTWH